MRKTRSDKKIVLTYGDIKEGKLRNFIKENVPGEEIGNSQKACNVIKALAAEDPGVEKMWIIFLNVKNKTIAIEMVGSGSVSSSMVYPREVLKRILTHNAKAIIMAHNHPSGDVKPSPEDDKITKTMYSVTMLVECVLHDHLIVGEGTDTYYSYSESGMMNDFKKTFEEMF
jgi:DNA repair protein RadC